jgi:hypothetical protein
MREFMIANLSKVILSFDLMTNEEHKEEITSVIEELYD